MFACCVVWNGAVVRTLAGGLNGTVAAFGDGTGSQAGFNQPVGVAVDASGNMYVADLFNHRVRKVTPAGGARLYVLFTMIFYSNLKSVFASLAKMSVRWGCGRVLLGLGLFLLK